MKRTGKGSTVKTIHPGEILREEFLKPMKITPYELAKRLHVPVPRINDIVREKRGITADTAVRLAKFFGTTEPFWMNLQSSYVMRFVRRRHNLLKLFDKSSLDMYALPRRYSSDLEAGLCDANSKPNH